MQLNMAESRQSWCMVILDIDWCLMPYLLGHVSVLVQQTPWLVSAKVVVFFKIVHKGSMVTIICLINQPIKYGFSTSRDVKQQQIYLILYCQS
jgi:hypothetical protein